MLVREELRVLNRLRGDNRALGRDGVDVHAPVVTDANLVRKLPAESIQHKIVVAQQRLTKIERTREQKAARLLSNRIVLNLGQRTKKNQQKEKKFEP